MSRVQTKMDQELDIEIDDILDDWQEKAKSKKDLVNYLFCGRIKTELTHLRAVGKLASRIYQNHSDETAWDELFDALSTAGLLSYQEE